MSDDLRLKLNADASQLKKEVEGAKADIRSLDKTAKGAGGGSFESLNKNAGSFIGKIKEAGSKIRGLAPAIGGLSPGFGIAGIAVAGMTLAINHGIERLGAYKQLVKETADNLREAAKIKFNRLLGVDDMSEQEKAERQLRGLAALKKKIQKEADDDAKKTAGKGIGAEFDFLADNSYKERQAAREKTLSEIAKKEQEQISIVKKARDDAEVKASAIEAARYMAEKERTEKLKEQYEIQVISNAADDEKLKLLNASLAKQMKSKRLAQEGSAEQYEAAIAILDIQKQIKEITDRTAAEAKKLDDDKFKKESDLADMVRERRMRFLTLEQQIQVALNEGREAEKKFRETGSVEDEIEREKKRKAYLDLIDKQKALNQEKKAGEDKGPTTKDGKVKVSQEDRARSNASRERNAIFTKQAEGQRLTDSKVIETGARNPAVSPSTPKPEQPVKNKDEEISKSLKNIETYLKPQEAK